MESALADSVPCCNLKDRTNVFVWCPFRRVSLCKGTMLVLLRLGFGRAQVSRREGYDGKKPSCPTWVWLCSKCTFRAHPCWRAVCYLLDGLLSDALAAGPAIGWRQGQPSAALAAGPARYRAHCDSDSCSCLERLENLFTASGSYCPACDSCQWHRTDPKLVFVPPVSLAQQHAHEFIGRR